MNPSMPSRYRLTEKQVMDTAYHMYGAIQVSCRTSQAAVAHLDEHFESMDGILVWMDILKTNDNEGYVEIHVATLTAKTNKKYNRSSWRIEGIH